MIKYLKSLVHVLNVNWKSFTTFPLQKLLIFFYARIIMNKIYHIIIISLALFLLFSCSPTQQLGKIYNSQEADELFGNVIFSTGIPRDTVANILDRTENNIMFGIINQNVIVLDNKRNLLYPSKAEFNETDVFTVYSVSIVRELLSLKNLNKGGLIEVAVEQRREVLSVSYDGSTLETGTHCPPYCN